MITKLVDIVAEARRRGPRRLAVACAADAHTLEAVAAAAAEEIVSPVLYGDSAAIAAIASAEGIDISGWTVIDVKDDKKAVAAAVKAVAEGGADVLMKGLVSTDVYMRGILNKDCGLLPPKGVLSHVSVIELPGRDRLLTVADVADVLGIGLAHAYEVVRRQDFPTITLGSRIIVPRDKFIRWIEEKTGEKG